MSKIVEKIKALALNEKQPDQWVDIKSSFIIDTDSVRDMMRVDILRRYSIDVKLGAEVLVNEHNYEHLSTMVENVKRAVIEELYSEFRKPLIALEINIAEGNRQKSLEIVRDIHATMFGRNV